MKKNTRKRSFRFSLALIIFVVAAVIVLFGIIFLRTKHPDKVTQSFVNSKSDQEHTIPPGKRGNSITSTSSPDKGSTTDSGSTTNSQPSAAVKILKAYQQGNGDLVIQTEIDGAGDGSCSLVMTNGGSTISKSVDVLYQPSYSTCTGFVIPISEFSNGGSWSTNLSVIKNQQTIAQTSQQITVNK